MTLGVLLAVSGCQSSRRVTHRSELEDPVRTGPITVYAKDHRLYELSGYVLADSVIRGLGTVEVAGKTAPYEGEIPLSSIVAIKSNSQSTLRGFVAIGAAGLFISALVAGTGGTHGLSEREEVVRHYPTSGGDGSSCPYVYAWNGERYVLEAEPFGVGLGKALELTTFHLLPSAREENGIVRLLLTDERQETHYVNSLSLMAIDLGASPGVFLDANGTAWPLAHPQQPVAASDRSGRSILSETASADGQMWECDASSLTAGSGYEDVFDFTFSCTPGATSGSLVLTGINTALSTAVFGQLCRVVGDQAIALTHAIDTDPELIARLRDYLDDASLKVLVWNGSEWQEEGAFRPEANAVTFTRGLRIRIPDGAGDTVRVRMRSMADVWKVDAIAADWTAASPLPMRPVDLLSAVGPAGDDLRQLIQEDDDRYAILFPPDRVELSFAAAEGTPGARIAYAVAGRGYLHEWIPEGSGDGVTSLAAMVPRERRIDFLKELLKHREIVLQPVYEEWAKGRE
jgi:hypothetical protein